MDRLSKILEFSKEIDKLKAIKRQSRVIHEDRRENTAEHSWHLAMMTWALSGEVRKDLNLEKCLKMALLHDIVEIDAGDTFVYGGHSDSDKYDDELKAAHRIFSILPDDLRNEFIDLWKEFEAGQSEESKFVKSVDRYQPLVSNLNTDGYSWIKNGVKYSDIASLIEKWLPDFPKLGELALRQVKSFRDKHNSI